MMIIAENFHFFDIVWNENEKSDEYANATILTHVLENHIVDLTGIDVWYVLEVMYKENANANNIGL